MTFKELITNTKDIFQWAVVDENVQDPKTNEWKKDYPVYGAFYRGFYCGYWYKRKFYMFEMLDGTDEEVWLDSDDRTEYTSTKKVLEAISQLNETVKCAEQFMKEVEIKQDFED